MTCSVRPARLSDADALGVLHVQAWQETYAGIMPADLLQALSPVQRAEMWRRWLTRAAAGVYVCEEAQTVVGFGLCGAQRSRTLPNHRGEVYAINILRRAQGRGFGRAMMQAMAQSLDERGRAPMTLLVLFENIPARQFYLRLGGRVIGEVMTNFGGVALREEVYCWDDLPLLAGRR